jgi:hypothetical protein
MYTKKCPSLLENIPPISHQYHHHIRAFFLLFSELRDISINMSVRLERDERRHMHIYSSFSAFSFSGAISDYKQGDTPNDDLQHFFRLCCALGHLSPFVL